ncbi:MAG: hypothetical protein QOE71_1008 [Pseudonocardiales bacterium]|jgi:hypothetical protein|nr:hypothetical protein [Pseudonocardiales bacterium]
MSTSGSNAVLTEDEQFLALLCGDEDLLRAEFDVIIAAEWPGTPARPPGADSADERAVPASRPSSSAGQRRPPNRLWHPGIAEWSRQRSPPAGPPGD